MKKYLSIGLILLLGFYCFASPQKKKPKPKPPKSYGHVVIAEVTSIYDGDTFRCNIKDYPTIIGERIPIRVNGIDCPEMKDNREEVKELARQAKQFTVGKLRGAKIITLKNMQRGKYFRIVADVDIDGQDLGKLLIQEGLAQPYDGSGKKPKWGRSEDSKEKESSQSVEMEIGYIASSNSKVFHRPGCDSVRKISLENVVKFESREEAVESGRRGCKRCRP